jgi:hypothetical protein
VTLLTLSVVARSNIAAVSLGFCWMGEANFQQNLDKVERSATEDCLGLRQWLGSMGYRDRLRRVV